MVQNHKINPSRKRKTSETSWTCDGAAKRKKHVYIWPSRLATTPHHDLYSADGVLARFTPLNQHNSIQHVNFRKDWEVICSLELPAALSLLRSAAILDVELARLTQDVVDG